MNWNKGKIMGKGLNSLCDSKGITYCGWCNKVMPHCTCSMTDWNNRKIDDINAPTHYNKHGVEAIDAIKASMDSEEFLGYLKGNIIKYLWRLAYKDTPLKNALKAQWYMNKLVKELEPCRTLSTNI